MADPSEAQYSVPTHVPHEGGGLPLTGFDLAAPLLVAVGLVAAGAWMRRAVGPR